jgi:hypothetical protein
MLKETLLRGMFNPSERLAGAVRDSPIGCIEVSSRENSDHSARLQPRVSPFGRSRRVIQVQVGLEGTPASGAGAEDEKAVEIRLDAWLKILQMGGQVSGDPQEQGREIFENVCASGFREQAVVACDNNSRVASCERESPVRDVPRTVTNDLFRTVELVDTNGVLRFLYQSSTMPENHDGMKSGCGILGHHDI